MMTNGGEGKNATWLDAVHRVFERLLRWLYPPMLVFVLLQLSVSKSFDLFPIPFLVNYPGYLPWIVAIACLAIGAAAYLFQSQVINVSISFISVLLQWEVNANYENKHERSLWLEKRFEEWASIVGTRWGDSRKGLIGYMDYAWALYHATSLTGWLTLVAFWFKAKDSIFAAVPWGWVIGLGLVLFFFSLITYAYLSKVGYLPKTKGRKAPACIRGKS